MSFRIFVPLVAASIALSACQTGMGTKQTVGTVGGAVAGGVIGSQIGSGTGRLVATGVGTLVGAVIGGQIGASLDRADQAYAAQTYQTAFETSRTGQTSEWRNPDSGNYGTVTPTRTYVSSGQQCREYTQTIYVQGQAQTGVGTACRNADGTWTIRN